MIRLMCHTAMIVTLGGSLACVLIGNLYAFPQIAMSGILLLMAALAIQFFLIVLEFRAVRRNNSTFADDN